MASHVVVLELTLVYTFIRELENSAAVAHVVTPATSVLRAINVR